MNVHYLTSLKDDSNINAAQGKLLYFSSILKSAKLVTLFKISNNFYISLYRKNVFLRYFNYLRYAFNVNKNDIVISYNYQYYYFIMVVLAKIKGAKLYLDIEDAPTKIIDKFFIQIYRFLSDTKARLYANEFLKIKYGKNIDKNIIFYGSYEHVAISKKFDMNNIIVHLGGTHNKYTGITMLIDLLIDEKINCQSELVDYKFIITGILPDKILRYIESLSIDNLILMGKINSSELDSLYEKIDIGLQLRQTNTLFSIETFPSKVLEYIRRDIHVISSDVSDIKNILYDEKITLLDFYNKDCLKKSLLSYKREKSKFNSGENSKNLINLNDKFRIDVNEVF